MKTKKSTKKKLAAFALPALLLSFGFYGMILWTGCGVNSGSVLVLGLMWVPAVSALFSKLMVDHSIRGMGWRIHAQSLGGPIMALLSTLNSSFAYNAITIGQSCDDGWLPKAFGKKNKAGARPYILTFMYILGIIPIIFGLSITTITNMVQLITSAFALLNFAAELKMPKKYAAAWKKSRFHVPDAVYYAICTVSLFFFVVVLWKSLLSMSTGLALLNVVVIIACAVIGFMRSKTGNIEIHTSVWDEDPVEEPAPAQE